MPKAILTLTPGDPDGIGPEIVWKAIRSNPGFSLLCVGAKLPFTRLGAKVIECSMDDLALGKLEPPKNETSPFVWLLPAPEKAPDGKLLAGYQSGWAIQEATQLVLSGKASALVTGPISKERLQKGGFSYPGHTEFLADLCQRQNVTMMLANQFLRVSLVTVHIGIKDVSTALTRQELRRAILQTAEGLSSLWGIKTPRIGIAALNPHAGEAGLFGNEENDVIKPEIEALTLSHSNEFQLAGPFPADTLFAKQNLSSPSERFDAIVCMYHDQGLIPVKLLDFHKTVNITLGLPMIRTSVDHGVGFDIAGRGIADPSSLCSAIDLAMDFVQKRF
ncbi:MAG: 4-hydroxythreonine-4-phosphate dehydrogenase PdxA [Bdellovibrionia bacterium]